MPLEFISEKKRLRYLIRTSTNYNNEEDQTPIENIWRWLNNIGASFTDLARQKNLINQESHDVESHSL